MIRILIASALLVLGGLLGGCSTYLPDYAYFPSPALVVIPQDLVAVHANIRACDLRNCFRVGTT